jgi:hypothetical protein
MKPDLRIGQTISKSTLTKLHSNRREPPPQVREGGLEYSQEKQACDHEAPPPPRTVMPYLEK